MADPGFKGVQDVIDHLLKPENQLSTDLFVLRWDGLSPLIARNRLRELTEESGLAEVTYLEYVRRKRRPNDADEDQMGGA